MIYYWRGTDFSGKKGTHVRIITGYLVMLLLIPAFIGVVILTFNEAGKVESLPQTLENHIDLKQTKLSQTSLVTAANGESVSEIFHPMNRTYLQSAEIPDFINKVFIVSEDQNFLRHPGFDLSAIGRALAANLQSNEIEQGASTITQQLARNQYLNHDRSYNRKLSEILYAYQIERTFTKAEILEQYLNAIYFQHNAYGIHAAADFYFQKQPLDLSKAEQAFLAAIPNNPSFYDPLRHFERTKGRQEMLIDLLVKNSQLESKEAEKIKHEKIILNVKPRKNMYPDYTDYVLSELKELMASENQSEAETEALAAKLLSSGITIHTGLDPAVQERTTKSLTQYLPFPGVEGAAAVINHETGLIVALAGGKNYQLGDFNRSYQAFRQPGSAIKPLLVYAPYLEKTGASAMSPIDAGPICLNGYCPRNYGGSQYGKVTIEKAFTNSYNTAAVRLLQEIGVNKAFSDLQHFNFEKITSRDHVLAAAVGGFTTGMSPLELSEAYTVFSTSGSFTKPRAIVKVTDRSGKLLYKWNTKAVQVWSPATAGKVKELMRATVTEGTAGKANIANQFPGGKTGTTNDFKDFWFIGYNGPLTAGIWVGKDLPGSMADLNSQAPHLHIWREIMKQ
jgi:penicillin-binding protein 1A